MQQNKNKSASRILYIDAAKAIAMISVVMFHACTNQDPYLAKKAYLIQFLSAFAMPSFFFINGFLYKNKHIDKPAVEIWRKIKAYYGPFLIYNLVYLLLHNLFAFLHMVDAQYGNSYYDLETYLKHFLLAITGHREFFSGALWFLGSILILNIIYIITDYIILKIFHGQYKLTIFAIFTFLIIIAGNSGYVPQTMKLAESCINSLYFFFGITYRELKMNNLFENKKKIFIVIGIISNLLITYNKLYNPFGCNNFVIIIGLNYVNSILVIIALILVAQISCVQNNKMLNAIGKNTMDIMALHFMMFKIVSFAMILYYGLSINRLAEYPVLVEIEGGWWILYTIVGVALPTLFSVYRHKFALKEKYFALPVRHKGEVSDE